MQTRWARWIVGSTILVTLLVVQLIDLAILTAFGPLAARQYLLGNYVGLVDWGHTAQAVAVVRALILLSAFPAWATALLGVSWPRMLPFLPDRVGRFAFAGWIALLLV